MDLSIQPSHSVYVYFGTSVSNTVISLRIFVLFCLVILLAERLILFAICMQMISSLRTEGTGWCIDSGRFDAVGVCYWGVIILARTGGEATFVVRSESLMGKGLQNSVRVQEETGECVGSIQKGNEAGTEI